MRFRTVAINPILKPPKRKCRRRKKILKRNKSLKASQSVTNLSSFALKLFFKNNKNEKSSLLPPPSISSSMRRFSMVLKGQKKPKIKERYFNRSYYTPFPFLILIHPITI